MSKTRGTNFSIKKEKERVCFGTRPRADKEDKGYQFRGEMDLSLSLSVFSESVVNQESFSSLHHGIAGLQAANHGVTRKRY